MGSLTLTSRQKNRRLPQVDIPVIQENDELRRFSESIKEHLRMYEGDSGAPKERFVTIEELEHVGLVTTKVQQGFASIDKILGEQIAVVPSVIPVSGSPGFGGINSGIRTLRALDDTAVDGIKGGQGIAWNGSVFVPKNIPNFDLGDATRYDMMYFDGADWRHTKQELQWNPDDDYLQIANAHSINWLDTSDATQDFLDFAAVVGGAPAGAVGHIIAKITSGVTTTSGTYVSASGYLVPFSSMEANKDYAVFVRAYIGNSTSSVTSQNKVRLAKGGVEVVGSEYVFESPTTIIDDHGVTYSWGGIVASGASGDLQLQHLSGNGTDTVFVNNLTILMIKVDDLINNTNIFHDTDTGLVELDDGDFPAAWMATGAGVTIGDGTSDYLVFGSVRVKDFTTGGNTVDTRVNDGTAVLKGTGIVLGDFSDELSLGFFQLWQAPASGTTLSLEAHCTGFPVDKVYASIIAIRMDAFVDYHSDLLATSPNLGNGPITLATVAFTTADSDDYGFISGATGPNLSVVGPPDFIRNDLNTGGDVTIGGSETQQGSANVGSLDNVHIGVSVDQALSSGDAIDADFVAVDAATPAIYTNNFLLVFAWTLAGDGEFFDVGNAGFTTRMKGKTTRFYDTGLTDFVEFDHDDTDFNITGFQTTDINITGITALKMGTVDLDADAITATSYEAILAADILSRIKNESITGDWTFDDATFSVAGATAANEVTFAHDDTDLNITGLNTTDINISGITAIAAGTVDADFDAITATTYGGITEANLVDKTAVESIAGQWDFTRTRGAPAQYAISVVSATPFQEFVATGASADEGSWAWGALATSFIFRSTKDNDDTGTAWLTVNRTAEVVDNATFGVPIFATSYGGITEANLVDRTDVETVSGAWTYSGNLISTGYFHVRTTTTAALDAIGNAINTAAGKVAGAMLYNTDTDNPVYAVGSADGDIWVDGAGATAHTPA